MGILRQRFDRQRASPAALPLLSSDYLRIGRHRFARFPKTISSILEGLPGFPGFSGFSGFLKDC